jgi:hypothetical protein
MPLSSVCVAVDGVIRNQGNVPVPVGISLYHSLISNCNILLYSESGRKELDRWLALEALTVHSAVEYNEDRVTWLSPKNRKLAQVRSLRNRGFHIDLVIEPDPEASAYFIESGFNVMTFTHAQYALPEWRPDYEGKDNSWKKFEEASIRMKELKAVDMRMKEGK